MADYSDGKKKSPLGKIFFNFFLLSFFVNVCDLGRHVTLRRKNVTPLKLQHTYLAAHASSFELVLLARRNRAKQRYMKFGEFGVRPPAASVVIW